MRLVQKQAMLYNESITRCLGRLHENVVDPPAGPGKTADGSFAGGFCQGQSKSGRIL